MKSSSQEEYFFRNKKLYLLLLLLFLFCFLLRLASAPLPGFIIDHISNFALTGVLYLISSYELYKGKKFTRKKLLFSLLPFALLNIIGELFINGTLRLSTLELTDFNTADTLDLFFGLLSLVFIYSVIINTSETVVVSRNS